LEDLFDLLRGNDAEETPEQVGAEASSRNAVHRPRRPEFGEHHYTFSSMISCSVEA
jgi:hypothetical protein